MPDPVYIKKQINNKTKIKNKLNYKFILNIGRLTNQKNQLLLIKSFFKISKKYKKLKLLILGEGEKYNELSKLVEQLNLKKKVEFLGYVNDPQKYINKSLCVIVSSLWEDPGFVMIEASALKKTVICSNCPSGPKEFFKNGKNGFLFKNNNSKSLIKVFNNFINSNKKKINLFIKKNYKSSIEYSEISHAKSLEKLLKLYEKR